MTEVLTGYSANKQLAAQQVTRGGKTVYIVSIPINLVPEHLSIPDAIKPIDSNRAVSKAHAEAFGDYWLTHSDSWTVPPLLVDCTDSLPFDGKYEIPNGPRMGVLELPNYSNKILRTLDGQHRIYGWDYIRNKIFKDLETAKNRLLQATHSGSQLEIQPAQKKVDELKGALSRMEREQVTLEIITGVSEVEHKQFFIDIADNALGINTSERTRLDEQNMTSRVAKALADRADLFANRIDLRKSSAAKSGKDVMSLANLRDVTRHACFGIVGKVTAAREKEFSDVNALEIVDHFVEAMMESAPALKQIAEGTYLPKTLRAESLLGSVTIWRCLAGAYNELAVSIEDNKLLVWNSEGHRKFIQMATEAIKKMRITDIDGKRKVQQNWYETDCFNPGEASPRSRSQDLKNLTGLFIAWASSGVVFEPPRISKK
jgi:RNA polymerase primary sigma factor